MAVGDWDMGGSTLIVKDLKIGATQPGQAGTSLSTAELTVLDAVTAGTASASKAVVLDSSKNVTGVGLGSFVNSFKPAVVHTGNVGVAAAATGTDTTPAVTETYYAQVFVPQNCTITGVSLLNGSAVAGNVTVQLCDQLGAPIAAAKSASTAQSGTAGYQQIPFATPYVAQGPQTFVVAVQFDSTSARFRSHILGNFYSGKKTGETYGTITTLTLSGFTTNLGPVASLY